VIRRPNPFLQVIEDFNSFADAMAKKQYWRTPCEASMKSRIRAPLLRFSQIVRYPLYCQRAPRSKILRGA
jgi:hypothetical protein